MQPISALLGKRKWPEKEATCPEHGSYIALQTPRGGWTTCPACFERRQAEIAQKKYQEGVRIMRDYAMQQALGQAALPFRFRDRPLASMTPAFPAQAEALKLCRDYVESWQEARALDRNMLLMGASGSGKTHLATAVASEILMAGHTALYTRADTMFQTVRETYSDAVQRTEKQAIEGFSVPELLVIDEYGRTAGTDAERRIFFSVIDLRYEKLLPTLIVSNLTLHAFQESVGMEMFSRLMENNATVFEFLSESVNVRFAKAQ